MGCVNHFILLILLLVAIPVIQADLYKKVDKNGHVYFTDNPVGGGFKLIMRTPKKGTIEYKNFQRNRRQLTPLIKQQARQYKVDPALVSVTINPERAHERVADPRSRAVL